MAKINRDAIVARAIKLMLIGGYDDTSMDQIATACGIRKASLYHHFPKKDALVLAAITQIHEYFRKQIFVIAWQGKGDAKTRLHALNEATFDFFLGREGGCLLGNFALALTERAPQFQAPLCAYFDDWAAAITHLLASTHTPARARELAFDTLAQIQGSIMMMRLYREAQHLRRALDATLKLV